ncbi:hypothetical protein FRC00_014557 [Tulasnella sp. 408]|nr:hypothetical protein FRC00_014557 [Tulasnella sp. 408]
MHASIRAASALARAAQSNTTSTTSSAALAMSTAAATKGRSRNQPKRAAKPVNQEFVEKMKVRKTHKRWNYARIFQKTDIRVGPISEPRTLAHYHNTLSEDLLYLTYRHGVTFSPQKRPEHDPENPYTRHRPAPQPKGGKGLRPAAPPTDAANVVKLEKIVLHTHVKEAQTNRQAILSAMALFRQLSGELEKQGGQESSSGVVVCRARKQSSSFRITKNLPIAVKVELRGEKMYEFINSLAEFVLPRMRDFAGIVMPPPSASMNTPSAMSGVVAFGLPPSAMSLFPQVEVNFDSYPRSHGFHIEFITNARGKDAQNKARALVSGFRIPLVRK